jgi:hypothetical protein
MRTLLRVEPTSSVPMGGPPGTLTLARLPVRLRQFLTFALVGVALWHYLLAQLLATVTILGWNFVANLALAAVFPCNRAATPKRETEP